MTQSSLLAWPPESGAARFLTRRFAECCDDLDIDFSAVPRVGPVTALLGMCLRTLDGQAMEMDTLWQWTVAERLQGLLAIARATIGKTTTAVAKCRSPGCGEQIELEFELDGFARAAPSEVEWQSTDGQRVQCHLPTGRDQHAWYMHAQQTHTADEQWIARRLITLIDNAPPSTDWSVPTAWLDPLGESLDTADPLTALTIDVSCPFCSRQLEVDVDLESLLLEGLRLRQHALLEYIHRLARAYHWTEKDIVALPPWRRARYLSHIREEAV